MTKKHSNIRRHKYKSITMPFPSAKKSTKATQEDLLMVELSGHGIRCFYRLIDNTFIIFDQLIKITRTIRYKNFFSMKLGFLNRHRNNEK